MPESPVLTNATTVTISASSAVLIVQALSNQRKELQNTLNNNPGSFPELVIDNIYAGLDNYDKAIAEVLSSLTKETR